MTREDVDRWLADYVEAWMTYDRAKIEALFAENVAYRYHPYDDPIVSRDQVIKAWVAEGDHPEAGTRDEPGTYEGSYRAFAVDGDRAVATGTSSYREEPDGPIVRTYDNCFVMRFDSEGRCSEFTEWFMQRKNP
jgi:hypothetical protein